MSTPLMTSPESVIGLVAAYSETLTERIDVHSPHRTKIIIVKEDAPWFDSDIENAKRHKRKAEKVWRSTGRSVHREQYIQAKAKAK